MSEQGRASGLEAPIDVVAEARAFDEIVERARRLGEARRGAISSEQRRAGCVEALSSMTLDEAARRLG